MFTTSSISSATPPALSWKPPPLSSFRFSRNCTAAGRWVASNQVEYMATLDYIRQSLPDDFEPPPTNYQIFEWFTSNIAHNNQTLYIRMHDVAVRDCLQDACRALEWQGIADLAGVGMVITYYLEAIFTTILLFLLSLDNHFNGASQVGDWLTRLGIPHPRIPYRLSAALYGCLDEFLNSATVFAISMLAASIFENSYNALNYGVETTVYATLLSMLLPIFTVFPVAILHAIARGSLRRARLRTTIWIVLVILVIAVCVLATATFHILREDTEPNFYGDRSPKKSFEWWCAPTEDQFSVRPAFKVGAAIFTISGGFWFIAILNFMRIPFLNEWKCMVKLRGSWWLVVAGLNFVGMWTYLGLFSEYRRLVVEKAGLSQQDTRWSVGQVLALATWAPVAVDFLYILVCECPPLIFANLQGAVANERCAVGPQAGLEERVSKSWLITAGERSSDDAIINELPTREDKAALVQEIELGFPRSDHASNRSSLTEDVGLLERNMAFMPLGGRNA